ncbi:hypothetical protein GJR96_12645 [Haloferax sp. MBLA0076]|uniref:Lipoprotein n=1 Tax=Haloferax litoreum TaxID=2666140 RepID=A0A6A8GIL2_9EURY|nr:MULTISPECIES: hypothetical protein [Haloferax]KAB1194236.1 hypothetical protein Hfx1148_12585 [Haloferax sp. CBA1148]MRX22796.1 hypothetical protein [Haloferax litoreum]
MRRRALLASVASLSFASTAGCLTDARRTVSGHIYQDHGYANLHAADEQYVCGSFPDDTDVRGWLFPDPPDDQRDVLTARAMEGEFSNDLLWAEGNSFVLLFEVRMPRDEAAFYNVGGPVRWTGWNTAEISIRRSETHFSGDDDAQKLVCTAITKLDAENGGVPSEVTLAIRDQDTGESYGRYLLRGWTKQCSAPSE